MLHKNSNKTPKMMQAWSAQCCIINTAAVKATCLPDSITDNVIVGQVMDDHKRTGLISFIQVANIPIPVQFSCWPQLLLSQILLPQANVSFTGHLCGIFAGLLHVFLPKAGTAHEVSCL